MLRVLSTYLFVNYKLSASLLAEIERADIPMVELFSSLAHFDYRDAQEVRELGDWFADHKLRVHSLHGPTSREFAAGRESGVPISISDLERVRRLDAVDEVKRALDVAERIPFRILVQHLGASREGMDPRRLDAAFSSLEHLVVFAKQRGVTIALENTPGDLAAPANLRHFIEDTRLRDLRLCFDTGHAHMEEGVERSFETMREWVVTTHVHDNHSEKDEHLLPGEGSIDWAAASRALRTAPVELPFVLELKEQAPGSTRSFDQIRAAFDRLEREFVSAGRQPTEPKTTRA
jgi:sugar phosphate isomerase/epimerase